MNNLLRRLLGLGAGAASVSLSYEEARELAHHPDPKVRRSLAAREDVRPEILYYLAGDPSPEVRHEIASNRSTPPQADLLLAADADGEVRQVLAAKIARLAPDLSADEQDRLHRMTYEALVLLARDQIVRVRQIIAETLKDVADAPPEVIRRLAADAEMVVSTPVLENSPVLTDDDLLEIIESRPNPDALSAISRRRGVRARVAEAIAASDDTAAIAILLANRSAQIREETLDMLIDRAPGIETWHTPMVQRPQLSPGAASRLAQFVAENLLEVLNRRQDLPPETMAAVAATVRRRIDEDSGGGADIAHRPARDEPPPSGHLVASDPLQAARQMHQAGKLTEQVLAGALTTNDRDFVLAALAVRSGMPLALVRKIVATHSAKGTVALAWKAGLSMVFGVQLQSRLSHIPPSDVLKPKRDGGFPLTPEEMGWQIDFFSSMADPKA